jgi:ATP/maltotriose-dependent transcriptional regulator MalT
MPPLKPSLSKLFTPSSPGVEELLEPDGILAHSERSAKAFIKRRGQSLNRGLVDEAVAEAAFIVTELVLTEYESILAKNPDRDERMKFFRCSVGYGLKGYFSHRATSTVSFLKKRGINIVQHQLHESMLVEYTSVFDLEVCLEVVCADEKERMIVEFHAIGNTRDEISAKVGVSSKFVKKTLNRIQQKLLTLASREY